MAYCFASTIVPAIAALQDGGVLAIAAPLPGGAQSQQFDVVHFNRGGQEIARGALVIPDRKSNPFRHSAFGWGGRRQPFGTP